MKKRKSVLEEKTAKERIIDSFEILKNSTPKMVGLSLLGGALVTFPFATVTYPLIAGAKSILENKEYLQCFLDKDVLVAGSGLYSSIWGFISFQFLSQFCKNREDKRDYEEFVNIVNSVRSKNNYED